MSLAGRTLYHIWHRPFGAVKHSLRHGGPLKQLQTEKGRYNMELAAASLPSLALPPAPANVVVHLITGARFWYQTAFCLHSLASQAGIAVFVEIYDDGTLLPAHAEALRRLGLPLRLHPITELRANLDRHLPEGRFPTLRERWLNYPNIRKLIDVHLGSTGWKLVIDSDLIFFRRPDFVLSWLAAPNRPLHAVDCSESYGYTRPLLEQLAGAPLPALVNVGLCGLSSDQLDWNELEMWTRKLIERENTNYYLEQALVAMLAVRVPCAIAPPADYVTLPSSSEVARPTATMHHYVDTAKHDYFHVAWRAYLQTVLEN